MARRHELIYALNAGGVDRQALARIDLEKMRITGEHPVQNLLPKTIGPAMLRPGLGYVSGLPGRTRLIEFVRDSSTTALLSIHTGFAYIFINGSPVTVTNSSSTITNPTFGSALSGSYATGWKDDSQTGDGTDGQASVSGAKLTLTATRYRFAAVQQSIAIAGGDQAKAHTVRIDVERGPVFVRMGTSQDGQELLTEQKLQTGTHKLTVTPNAANFWIKIRSEDALVGRVVTRVQFEHILMGGAGNLFLPVPWTEDDYDYLTWDQSADVLFIADGANKPRRIERRGNTSWSITEYTSRNGPLQLPETDKVLMTPSSYAGGEGTLTASSSYFKSSHVGTLFELTHNQQNFSEELNGLDQTSEKVTVRGLWVDGTATSFGSPLTFDDRNFTYDIDISTGTFVGTITLERSTDVDAAIWSKVKDFTADDADSYNDQQSNLLAHYRFRVTAYTSGYATVSISYNGGVTTGLVRIIGFTSSTQVTFETVTHIGSTNATAIWRAPVWSDDLGWPTAPRFFDSRLWWFLGDMAYGSIVNQYDDWDDAVSGDSAPVIRSVGAGAAEGVRWSLAMQRLIAGTSGYVASIRSSSFDEPITPTAFTSRAASSVGVAYVRPASVGKGAVFAGRSKRRLYELLYSVEANDYTSSELSRLNPEAFSAGIVDMAVQTQPDTRIYIVLDDGGCVVVTYERDEKVVAITTIETDGDIKSVNVLPGEEQDYVYFSVERNGGLYLEKLANEADQDSVSTCALLDGYGVLSGTISSITGANHLAGKLVYVWADGQRRADSLIDGSGNGTLDGTYSRVVYGLLYTGIFKTVKLAYAAQLGTALGQTKIVRRAGLVLANSCLDGITIGKDEDNLGPMPVYVDGSSRTNNQFFEHYDHDLFPIYSDWDADSRVMVRINSAEGPVTIQAMVLDIEERDGVSTSPRDR